MGIVMRMSGVLFVSATTVMAACGGNKDTAANDSAAPNGTTGQSSVAGAAGTAEAPAGAGGAATPADSTRAPGSPVPASTAQMTDPEIVSLTQAADEGEIATSQIARTKATNPDVRKFAQQMITEHTRMIAQRNGQLKATKMAPAAGAKDSSKATADKMVAMLNSAPKGAAFDTAYINGQVMAHQATLTMVQKAEGVAKDPGLKTMLTNAAPVVQKHLDEAKALQGKLAGGTQGASQ